jgi:hypothetical protein
MKTFKVLLDLSHLVIINQLDIFSLFPLVKAKAMTQLWAQYRYGVFEEHGYPGDSLLPYFYRHPDGYDAVTTSNDTVINGNLVE